MKNGCSDDADMVKFNEYNTMFSIFGFFIGQIYILTSCIVVRHIWNQSVFVLNRKCDSHAASMATKQKYIVNILRQC